MTQPRLSIVICTYNGAAYLQPQLDSLLAQTRLPDEIVIGDDGSTDATPEILQRFAERARHAGIEVRLRRNPANLGYVENFSAGLRQAGGDVLFLCDQDDVWRPDKLASMAERFRADPSLLLLHSDARLVDAGGESLGCSLFDALQLTAEEKQAIHADRAFEVVLRRSFVTGATAAFRRELVELALPVAQDWIHDEWLAAVAAAAGRVDFIDEPLIDYRQHDANQIGMRRRTLAMKWRDLLLPRGRLLSDEAGRLRRLEAFLAEAGLRDGVERAVQIRHKRSHFERRVAIGRLPRLRRLLPVLHEAREGCYGLYGTGGRSVLRDLLRHD
ncbi:glycosyl transferase family 2 [Rhodanobacter sp. B04]|uniref:glycosyltransferase family 2 protein n=1 Tax=Rhodanobacter sp. B04 TaxID=1945860 RepID=UPI000986D5E1|nr:glycosyltransferase family 2 protein [Rhodanobacter sp. B04]OOG66305.1 glycosyl transferase family 2 [Rhodanobacter sp. B04]